MEKETIIITNPMIAANRSAEVTLSKFLRVIHPCFDSIRVIGGNLSVESDLSGIKLCSYSIIRAENKIKRILDVFGLQFKMAGSIFKYAKKDCPIYFWIADKMIIPYLAAKMKGAEINYFIYGNVAKEGTASRFTHLSSKLIRLMAAHADFTCIESKSVIHEWPGLKCKAIREIHLYTESTGMNPIKERKNIFGMVCRLTAGKHVLECIEAMNQVHKCYPDWHLEVIGSGRQQAECEQLIEKLEAGKYVKLLGWVDHKEIVERSKQWKYLLFPTDTEGMPNALIEMMGRGIPALASPVGGVADLIVDQVNGVVLSGYSDGDIVVTMQKAIAVSEDAENYSLMAERAFQTIKNEFVLETAQKAAMRTIDSYTEN